MKAVKANKEYTIDEARKAQYIKDGFDIIGDDGKVVQQGAGKTVPFAKYQAALDENTALKQQVEDLRSMPAEKETPKK